MNDIKLITYQDLLNKLKDSNNNHLLLGNGFNNSLGIKTNYSEIFSLMKKEYSGYQHVKSYLEKEHFDIERLIGYLKQQIPPDEGGFLKDYIERKVKLDFMRATNEIVQESIKEVYREKNKDIHLFFRNFTNYFTLNYDPFLYLILLKFKKDESDNALAIQNTPLFQAEDLDQNQNNIYSEIQNARETGDIQISIGESNSQINLNKTSKTSFLTIINVYNKNEHKGWTGKDIDKVCNQIWIEENNKPELEVNDGFQGELFKGSKSQNLYFLHGAFQIVENKKSIQKITAKQNKSFVSKLEKAIHSEDRDIVCVLTSLSDSKKVKIENNNYLKKCFDNLSKIDGTLVILGSSLAKNDEHIFTQINNSDVTEVYISSCERSSKQDFGRAKEIFTDKEITLFDYKTISYQLGGQS